MRSLARVAVVALILLGPIRCSPKTPVTAPEPEPKPPPELVATSPNPRNRDVPVETEIWAQFREPLDSLTVDSRNVSLKLDTQFIPATVTWDATALRVRIRPRIPLLILRTYTARLEPGLATRDGRSLGTAYFWQFKTRGVRTVSGPYPPDRTVEESPFTALSWDSVGAPSSLVVYELYTGTDSAAIAERRVQPLVQTHRPIYVPRSTWGFGTRFWSITITSPSTGERLDGPVWRFDTLSRDTPTDTLTVTLSDWGYYDYVEDIEECFGAIRTATTYRTAIRWELAGVGPRKLAGAQMRLAYIPVGQGFPSPSLFSCLDYWNACGIMFPGPPHTEASGFLTSGRLLDVGLTLLSSDALTAHLEAMLRRQGFYGYVITAPEATFLANGSTLTLRWYRTGVGAARP